MTKSERNTTNTLRDTLIDAQKYLDSGLIGEGLGLPRQTTSGQAD